MVFGDANVLGEGSSVGGIGGVNVWAMVVVTAYVY